MSDLLKQVDQKSRDLAEGKLNETGHDDVKSAKNQVQIAMSALQKMSGELGKLNDEDSLPTWWTNKVAVSVDKLDGMADYLDTQVESKQVNEESMKCPRCGTMNETPFDKCSNCGLPKAEFSSFKKEEEVEEARQLKDPKKETMVVKNKKVEVIDKKDLKKYLSKGYIQAEKAELDEASARRDAMRAMGKEKDKDSDDVVATADDRKAADKNIIMQLRRLQDMKGKGKAMFADGKPANINPKLIDYALKMHGKMKPQDKLKFQKAISKSNRDFLMTLKRTR
jgi:ribosomal protein L37E